MGDPQAPQGTYGGQGASSGGGRAGDLADRLRHALNTFLPTGGRHSEDGGQALAGLTPEALAEVAQRAGVTNPAQIADLQRMVGLGEASGAQVPQHVVFQLAAFDCALPADAVQGIEKLAEVTPVPNTVPWVMGVTQAWGMIVSVVDLHSFLGLPPQTLTSASRLMVVTKREMTIGFVVDTIREMRPLGDYLAGGDFPLQQAPEWARPYLLGAAQLDNRLIVLLDPERLLFSEKMHRYRTDVG
ncbi:MAG: chemotaxis protein CheW [Ktedonobacterales bacterium]